MRIARAAVLFGLLAGGSFGEDAVDGRVKWEQARLALQRKDGRGALGKFEEALRGLPADAQLLFEAAQCAFDLDEFEKAEGWIDKAVRTEDASFKQRPEYQQAIKLAATVRDVLEDIRRAASEPPESTYAKALEITDAGLAAFFGRFGAFLDRFFKETSRDKERVRYELRDEWSHPRRWSASGSIDVGEAAVSDLDGTTFEIKGGGIYTVRLREIETEEAAAALANRIVAMAKKHLPDWQRDARKLNASVVTQGRTPWEAWTEGESGRSRSYEMATYARKTAGGSKDGRLFCAVEVREHVPKGQRRSRFYVTVRMIDPR